MKSKKGLTVTSFRLEKRFAKGTEKKEYPKETPFEKREGAILNNVPILADFKFNASRVIYPIGYRIDFDKWNVDEQRVKRNNFNKDGIGYNIINKRISRINDQLPIIYDKALKLDMNITSDYLLKELNKYLFTEENPSFIPEEITIEPELNAIDYFQIFIDTEIKAKNKREGTVKKLTTLKKHLSGYNPNLHFKDITEDFFIKYINYLIEVKDLNNTTAKKNISDLKWFLNWATEKDYNSNLYYRKFKYKFEGTETSDYQQNIVFLTWDELQLLNNYDFSNNKRLEQIRDIFCFCCFTSLRYSDVANLKKHNVKVNDNDTHYLDFLTIKTNDKLIIPLNKYALAIWNKYKDIELKNNRLFPVPSNQKYNDYIKEVCKELKFNDNIALIKFKGNKRTELTFKKHELICTHSARKTFIINALYNGIQPDVIRSWTGHKDHKTMELYIKIDNEIKEISMNKFNEI